jgi:hypothetical protein
MSLISDAEIYHTINHANLTEATKAVYLRKFKQITTEIFPHQSLFNLLQEPEQFLDTLQKYANSHQGRQGATLGDHFKEGIMTAILSIFIHHKDGSGTLRDTQPELFARWMEVKQTIQAPITKKYQSNQPTERQQDGYIPFDQVCSLRDGLPVGGQDRLLLAMYTEIPPVRSDFHSTRVMSPLEAEDFKMTPHLPCNFIVISVSASGSSASSDTSYLVLEKYKTVNKYGTKHITLPQTLVLEITASLMANPRNYLFVGNDGQPFDKENSFTQWANRALKRMFQNTKISLTMLRHIYISRRDLNLETMSGLEQDEIAQVMGHSLDTQRKYLWHTWLKSNK